MMHHVLVGSGIASLSAAESIRRADPSARITVVSTESDPFYSRPGLAYVLTKDVAESQLAIRSDAELTALRLERMQGRARRIFPQEKSLQLEDGRQLPYDRLLIATGAASIRADFPGASLDGVVHLDDLAEARQMTRRMATARAGVVVGGGSTALELVDGFHAHALDTHYLMRGERYWAKVFDPVESAIVEARLMMNGVTLHRFASVTEAVGEQGRLTGVRTSSGAFIPCDLLAVAIGIRPRLELATASGIEVGRGIITNEFLETSLPDVYAAGDVAQVYDPVLRTAELDTLWASALQQGRVAGMNMSGTRVALRKRVPLNVTKVGGVTVTIVGAVGGAPDPDLLTLTRGQSERWVTDPNAWSVGGARLGDRLRVMISGHVIVGAVVMGDQHLSRTLAHLIGEEVDISPLRPALDASPDQDPEKAMDLLLDFCHAHVNDHAARH
ncbi:MAG: FAD-dependent oxidoreductase [Gemmatimonadaceae bacterium]